MTDVTTSLPPTGIQYEITSGDQRAVVTQIGATLRSYEAAGRPVLEAFGADEIPPGGHGQHLAPWPNRVAGGRWSHGGRSLQLPLSEPDHDNAIHGLVRWLPFTVAEQSDDAITLQTVLGAQPGWPFPLEVTVAYALTDGGLQVTVSGTNVGAESAPWGFGSHPYLAVPGGVDRATVTLPARSWISANEQLIPTGTNPVDGTPYELDGSAPIGGRQIDTAYADLVRDADDWVTVTVDTGDGWRTTVRGDETVRWLQVFTGDTLVERYRRTGLAVEPMTCPPDALNSGEGLIELAPGQTVSTVWTVHTEPVA